MRINVRRFLEEKRKQEKAEGLYEILRNAEMSKMESDLKSLAMTRRNLGINFERNLGQISGVDDKIIEIQLEYKRAAGKYYALVI
jgi:hypothetical protein